MSTHNIGFYGEIRNIIPELSQNAPFYKSSLLKGRLIMLKELDTFHRFSAILYKVQGR